MDEALMKRVLPHSIEAEQSVIGSMLMDKEAIIAASEIVLADEFYQRQYGVMFEAMVELFNEGKPVDRSMNPVGIPVTVPWVFDASSIFSNTFKATCLIGTNSPPPRL